MLLTLGATRIQAVAALRRAGGSADTAAEALLTGARERRVRHQERDAQRKFGKTADGSFVDPACVTQLTGMGISEKLAVAALKQTNNDVVAALDAAQTQQEALLAPHKKKPKVDTTPVDEMALAMLLSMGFDQAASEEALRASKGN